MTKTIHHPAYVAMIERLRKRRLELGLTQEDVASNLKVHRTWLCKVETLERRLDVIETCDLCRIYRIDPSSLVRIIEKRL